MKWMHVLWRRGSDDDLVRSFSTFLLATLGSGWGKIRWHTLTSVVEMLPTTLEWLSTTAMDEIPSLFMSCSASQSCLSPLNLCQ